MRVSVAAADASARRYRLHHVGILLVVTALVLLVLYETASDFNHTEWLALILIGCGDSALTVVQQWLGKRN